MSDNTFYAALRRMGYSGERHFHLGFRTTASTMLNEMNWNADWVERQLALVSHNKVRASYNKAHFLKHAVKRWLHLDRSPRMFETSNLRVEAATQSTVGRFT